jgi:hypothetical protein
MAAIKRDRMPPCKKDGVDCPKRQVGCRSTCKEYVRWEADHQATHQAILAEKAKEHNLSNYFINNTVKRELKWQLYMRRR